MTPDKLTPSKGAPPSAQASKAPPPTPAAKPVATPHSTSALIAAAGLPVDKLSAAIVSFARFFSLPLKPELMAAIRRQTLSPPVASAAEPTPERIEGGEAPKPHTPESGITVKSREALSPKEALALAAAAAESKGVELNPKGLEIFAGAIDPDAARRRNAEEQDQRRRRNKNHHERENVPETVPITAASLREMAIESAEKDPLLAILNRLPGKNGQRWVALPFSFCEEGRKFSIALRILLENDSQAGLMALDIGESGEHERSWLFVVDNRNMPARTSFGRLAVYLEPALPPAACAQLAGELSRLMEIPLGYISIRSRTETFPGESGLAAAGGQDDIVRSINEAV